VQPNYGLCIQYAVYYVSIQNGRVSKLYKKDGCCFQHNIKKWWMSFKWTSFLAKINFVKKKESQSKSTKQKVNPNFLWNHEFTLNPHFYPNLISLKKKSQSKSTIQKVNPIFLWSHFSGHTLLKKNEVNLNWP
jgi:hypothetical protein